MSANEALELARQEDLDLVEISPTAKPPVCKIMDFGKYRYEQTRKAKEAKKNQKQVVIKEVKVTRLNREVQAGRKSVWRLWYKPYQDQKANHPGRQ